MLRSIFLFILLIVPLPSAAWNAAGHRLTAAIAWLHLSPPARAQVTHLLSLHPAHADWCLRSRIDDLAYNAFLEASTWPDDIRRDPDFDSDPKARHLNWHYVDIDARGIASGDGELDRRLEQLIHQLSDPRISESAKATVLPWVIHLVGDLHQPLHVGSRNDAGGNGFAITDPFNRRFPDSNLHRWWDDLPGWPGLRGRALERAAKRLLARNPEISSQSDIARWKRESWELAQRHAYPSSPTITAEFRTHARGIADRRLAEAGRRLGVLLDTLFGQVSRETASK